jgi:hypothetical protein
MVETYRCDNCRGLIVYGGKPMTADPLLDGIGKRLRLCEECSHEYAWAIWPDDWGPYPHRLRMAGRA